MLPLPMIGLSTKILIGVGVVLVACAATAKFTHDHVSTKYQNILLKQEVAVRTVEREIAVLDTQTLNKALARERARWEREQKGKEKLNEIKESHQNDPTPWCELTADELLVWNCENTDFDDSCNADVVGGGLPGQTSTGNRPRNLTPVGQ